MIDSQSLPEELVAMLPEEIQEALRLDNEKKIEKLESFGQSLAKKRDEYVQAKAQCGIEEEWDEDEEAYLGIDDANRDEASGASKVYKPQAMNGSFISKTPGKQTRSTVFLNITRPYTDAASARVSDMLLPTDDRNWGISPTPKPELTKAMQSPQPVLGPQGQPVPVADEGGARPMTTADLAKRTIDKAKESAEAAEKQIEDWLVECQYHAEVRKVIEDCARLGTGVLKGPFPRKVTRKAMAEGGLTVLQEIAPACKRVDPRNFFPDMSAGENFQEGNGCFERDLITARKLRDLKGVPGYLDAQIEMCLEEGPQKRNQGLSHSKTNDKDQFEVWYFSGLIDKEDLELTGVDVSSVEGDSVFAIVTMVNEHVIKAALQPLDGDEFPYDMMPWQRRAGMPWGMGVARQIRTPQRILNAATRNMMDNAGLAGGPILIVRKNMVEPADGTWELRPRKVFYVREDGEARTVADAISSINVDSRQGDLMGIIQFAIKMAEEVTGIPALLQGQQGQAPDTVGGMQMLTNNANSVLRRIARTFDDCVTEPHIRRWYQWLMMYGEDEDTKGDFVIDARGSTTLVERDIANQQILQMGALVGNPAFGIDPKKWIEEMMKSQKLDPKRFMYDEEELAKMAQQPPPPPPQVIAAQIRAQADVAKNDKKLALDAQVAKMENQTDMLRIKSDMDRDLVYAKAEHEANMLEHQARLQELNVKRDLELLKYANERQMTLDSVKAQLAAKAADINLERELAGVANAVGNKPPLEPAGKAPDGRSWAQ